jgi:hypothetical protein
MAKPVIMKGETVIPAGAPVKGVILKSEAAGRIKGGGSLMLQVTSLTLHGKSYRLVTSAIAQEAKGRGKRSATMIGGGGGAGALIGGLGGVAIGMLTTSDTINLGEPAWKRSASYRRHRSNRVAQADESCTVKETATKRVTTCTRTK